MVDRRAAARPVTLKQIAERVGVHVSTVSRALDERTRHRITADVVERVLAAVRELDYRPNAAAYSLRTRRTRMVGIVVPDITNPIFPPIIRGAEDVLGAEGYIAAVVNTDDDPQREAALLGALRARGIDGLIVASVEREDDVIAKITGSGIALVTVNRRMDRADIASVVNDDADGIHQVLAHLVSLGHRHIGAIAGPPALSTGQSRAAAFRDFAAQFGLPIDERWTCHALAYNEAEGERCLNELIARKLPMTAVLTANDRLAIGAISALDRHGVSCPRDVSVTGFNDMAFADRITPPLTTVRIKQRAVGAAAAAVLLEQLAQSGFRPARPVHKVLPVELIVRRSTAAPAGWRF